MFELIGARREYHYHGHWEYAANVKTNNLTAQYIGPNTMCGLARTRLGWRAHVCRPRAVRACVRACLCEQ
jgi:hypothetical protein